MFDSGFDIFILTLGEDFNQNSCFSEYEIAKTLGEGGFGKVVLGIHKTTKEKVAIKIVNTGLIGKLMIQNMFLPFKKKLLHHFIYTL